MKEKILIIRLGALGDILLSMQAFQDIRQRYRDSHISFLTQAAFAGFARTMPWFDEVIVDPRAPFYRVDQWLALGRTIRQSQFTLAFDLQNKPRTHLYYRLFYKGTGGKWSGTAKGCSHPRPPVPDNAHHQDKILLQIRAAGIDDSGSLSMGWMEADISKLELPERIAVLIPGCAPHRPEKRWPAHHFAELAHQLKAQGITPVLIGTKADAEAVEAIQQKAGFAINLLGKTNFPELASLFRRSVFVIGNDTGPTHLAALVGAPTLAVMSAATNAAQSGPRGPRCAYLQRDALEALTATEALAVAQKL
jgi:ADP-heptose:LPS heptosyltransferase